MNDIKVNIENRELILSNLNKTLWPEGITKAEVIEVSGHIPDF